MRKRLVPLLRGLVNLLFVSVVSIAIEVIPQRFSRHAVFTALAAISLLLVYVAGSRWIERRQVVELRLDNLARGLCGGLVSGISLFSSVIAILWLVGVYEPAGLGSWQPLGLALLSALEGAVSEEIVFRGLLFRLVAGLGGNWTALAATAALFGLAHVGKPGATWVIAAALAAAGVLLGAAFAGTGSLWLPIGIHTGWNFAEGPVFGMEVSGNRRPVGWIGGHLQGPTILTGGAFGPEASIVAVAVCLMLAMFYLRKLNSVRSEPT
jgi:membrane protease YdiL (CAAX protease family)